MANEDNGSIMEENKLETHGSDSKSEKGAGFLFYFLAFVTAIIIMIVVPFGVFYYAIKNNVRNVADTYEDQIKNIPVLNMALPVKPDPDDPSELTDEELRERYTKIKNERDELKPIAEKVDELTKEVISLEEKLKKTEEDKKTAEENLKKAEENYKEKEKILEEQKNDLDLIAANGDPEGYKKYFEGIDKDLAEEIYKSLKEKDVLDEEAENFAKTYSEMEPEAAAAIFEELGINKIDLICDILKNLKRANTAEILSAMDATFAGQITDKLAKDYLYKVSTG